MRRRLLKSSHSKRSRRRLNSNFALAQAHALSSHKHTLFHDAMTTTIRTQNNTNNDQRRPSLQQQWPAPPDQVLHPAGTLNSTTTCRKPPVANQLTLPRAGHSSPTTPNRRDLHSRLRPPQQQLQLPAPPAPARSLNTASRIQRRALARHLPPLRNPLLHRHLHLDRKPPSPPGPHPRFRREPGLLVRGCV